MVQLSEKARAAYLSQRPDRRIIDLHQAVAPRPAAAPDSIAPSLGASTVGDGVTGSSKDKLARLREKFLGRGSGRTAATHDADEVSNGPVTPPRRHSAFVVTDVDGQIKVDIVDPETGDIEMEQG